MMTSAAARLRYASIHALTIGCLLLGLGTGFSFAAEPTYVLETKKTQSITAVYDFEIDAPHLTAKEWVLFAAQAPELPGQSGLQTRLIPGGTTYHDLSDRHRALLRARVPATTKSLQHKMPGKIEYQATLYSRNLVKREAGRRYAKVLPPTEAERAACLAESETLDFSAADFQAWLKAQRLHRKRNESDLDLGRRIFLAITRSLSYEYTDKMDRHASHVCVGDKADCGGMSVLFVAAMRANEVPARVLLGHWAKSSKPDATLNGVVYRQQHVVAEFFVDGLGWVPVDLSSAVVHDKTDEGLQYFGHDRGNFLTSHVDPDLKVDSVHFGEKTFPMLQTFRYYVTGTGKLDDVTFKMNWTVESTP